MSCDVLLFYYNYYRIILLQFNMFYQTDEDEKLTQWILIILAENKFDYFFHFITSILLTLDTFNWISYGC